LQARFLGAAFQMRSLREIEAACRSGCLSRCVGPISHRSFVYARQPQHPGERFGLGCAVARRIQRNGLLRSRWSRGYGLVAGDGLELFQIPCPLLSGLLEATRASRCGRPTAMALPVLPPRGLVGGGQRPLARAPGPALPAAGRKRSRLGGGLGGRAGPLAGSSLLRHRGGRRPLSSDTLHPALGALGLGLGPYARGPAVGRGDVRSRGLIGSSRSRTISSIWPTPWHASQPGHRMAKNRSARANGSTGIGPSGTGRRRTAA